MLGRLAALILFMLGTLFTWKYRGKNPYITFKNPRPSPQENLHCNILWLCFGSNIIVLAGVSATPSLQTSSRRMNPTPPPLGYPPPSIFNKTDPLPATCSDASSLFPAPELREIKNMGPNRICEKSTRAESKIIRQKDSCESDVQLFH